MLDNLGLLRDVLALSDTGRTYEDRGAAMFVERADALDSPPMSRRGGAGGQPSVIKRRAQRMAFDRPRSRLPPRRQNDLPSARLPVEVAREAEPLPKYDSRPPIAGARVGNYSRRSCARPRIAPWRILDDARRGG
jgi:hypothetical protein